MGIFRPDPIVIIRSGTFIVSTALHLVQNGYTDASVFQTDHGIPSRHSAVIYRNKIMRAEYKGPFYTDSTVVLCPDLYSRLLGTDHDWLVERDVGMENSLVCAAFSSNEPFALRAWSGVREGVDILKRFQVAAVNHPRIEAHVLRTEGLPGLLATRWPTGRMLRIPERPRRYAHSVYAVVAIYRTTQAMGVRLRLGDRGPYLDRECKPSSRTGLRGLGESVRETRQHPIAPR